MKFIFICPPVKGVPDIRLVKLTQGKGGRRVLSELAASCSVKQLLTIGRGQCDQYLERSLRSRN